MKNYPKNRWQNGTSENLKLVAFAFRSAVFDFSFARAAYSIS